jgi:chromosome segregation ATPase
MDSDDAALTSFIGEKPVQAQASEVAVAEVDRELEELKAENTQLKQKILTLEETNRALNTNLSETDLQLMAEKARADSLARLSAMSGRRVGASSGAPAGYEEAPEPAARHYDDAIAAQVPDGGCIARRNCQ